MLYRRSFETEHRLQTTLRLIRTGRYSTPMLAERLGTSIPTVSRYVTALRERGHDIRAERKSSSWRFVLVRPSAGRRRTGEASPSAPRKLLQAAAANHAEGT